MPFEIVTIPCRTDNYAFLLHDNDTGMTALVDAPEAAPIARALGDRGWGLDEIWITHHHGDHVEGVDTLRDRFGAHVLGNGADRHRLPKLDRELSVGRSFRFADLPVSVIDVPGHTIGHIAFHVPGVKAAFTADSLMAFGCGRVFEGTFEQMWASLRTLADLPPDTQICSGHEYTAKNAQFALTIEPGNPDLVRRAEAVLAATDAGLPTVPSILSEELATNPFLRAHLPEVKTALSMEDDDDASVFAAIRRRKDAF
jgi:hydroxyacylglutathione hydrolase